MFGDTYGETELAQLKLTQEAPALPLSRHDRVAVGLRDAVARTLRRRPSERYTFVAPRFREPSVRTSTPRVARPSHSPHGSEPLR